VLTTSDLRRLRFPGMSAARCRQRLRGLLRRGLVAYLPGALTRRVVRERCWVLTEEGAAALGRGPLRRPLRPGPEAVRLDELLADAQSYVRRQVDERVHRLAAALPAQEATREERGWRTC
jgi:hypothetical protein